MIKQCSKCKKELYIGEFHKQSKSKDGHDSQCKACKNKHYRLANMKKLEMHDAIDDLYIKCNNCNLNMHKSKFWRGQSICIECSKHKQKNCWESRTPKKRLEQHLKYKYKITYDEFEKTWNNQNGCCAICLDELPDLMVYENRRRGYSIDHNHETGEFRGILCLTCNTMIGMSKDSVFVLERAIKYLCEKGAYGKS